LSPKPKSLIPDTMVVICLHELGLWDRLCSLLQVVVPSTVLGESIYFEDPETNERHGIDLRQQVAGGIITEESATVEEVQEFQQHFDAVMLKGLHDGEVEALTLLWKDRVPGCFLCSADQAAVKALVLVGMRQKGISLEQLLHEVGLRGGKSLGPQYLQERFEQWVEEAKVDRIEGRGLARWPF